MAQAFKAQVKQTCLIFVNRKTGVPVPSVGNVSTGKLDMTTLCGDESCSLPLKPGSFQPVRWLKTFS